jgi:DNA polymerase-3 subunit gamma/tau
MTRQSLFRRYRPQRFADVRGQDNLVTALRRAVADDTVGQAYLFSGPRGTGKTSTARILAKALNCPAVTDGEPCGQCESCVAIAEGTSFDVIELDAASNNKVDDIRNLIDRALQGTPGRNKVYILDEVHMLSTGAANALLKTLEEPPGHVVFVLATTDPYKLPPTVRSRTQHFEVHLLDATELRALVDEVVADAGLDVDDEVKAWAVRTGAGSARDTLSALERAAALGAVPDAVTELDTVVNAFAAHDTAAALVAVGAAIGAGRSPHDIGNDLIAHLRAVFLTAVGVPPADLPPDQAEAIAAQAAALGARGATSALEILGQGLVGIARVPDPRVPLELAVVRITQPELDTSVSALVGRIERLEQALAGGAPVAVATAPEPTPAAPPAAGGVPQATATGDAGQPAPPGAGAGGGDPAAAARQVLASRRPSGASPPRRPAPRAATSPGAPPPAPAPAPAPVAPAAPPAAEVASTPPDEPATSDPAAADAGGIPTAPEPEPAAAGAGPDHAAAEAAWDRQVTASPDQKVRARFGAGRPVAVEGTTVVVALPNDRVAQRCAPLRQQVADALSSDLGMAVTVELRVDPHGAAQPEPARSGSRPTASDAPPADDVIPDDIGDVHSLPDATDLTTDDVQRITEVFPGSALVEVDQEPPQ